MPNSRPVSFTLTQRILHWLTALLVFFNLLITDNIETWKHAIRRAGIATAEQIANANIHAYVGFAILALVALRIVLRHTSGVPAAPEGEPAILQFGAKAAHVLLYVTLIAMPLSGAGYYYFDVKAAGDFHADVLKVVLWALLAAHVLGTLAHQFYWKTNVLRRMTLG